MNMPAGFPEVFVNVGGASPNFGESPAALSLENGLITSSRISPWARIGA